MNITRENVDALNAVVRVDIVADDYQATVTEKLTDYRKKADVPGFRKGHVPMGMIKKQYGKSIMMEEVNKLLQNSLNKFITAEKLEILGNPIPRVNENFNWNSDSFTFEFELGLAPVFEVDLSEKNKIKQYNIVATDTLMNEEVKNIQTRYGKVSPVEEATEEANITGTFVNEEKEINKKATFLVQDLEGKDNQNSVIGSKIGDVLELGTKKLFKNDHKLQEILEVAHEEIHDLDITITFTVEDITTTEPAALDQELFDKLFSDGSVTTEAELREKIKEDAEKQFQQQSDQQLLTSVQAYLIENTKFDLPAEFLKKWLKTAGEKELTTEEAEAEFEKSEKGLRYQLIEGKMMKDNDIKLDYKELVDYAKGFIRQQMAQFGNMNPEEKELDDIAGRILQNQEEAQKLQGQLISQKLITFFKEQITFKTEEVSYEDFVKEAYAQ
ncbi:MULTISPECIES: trigger factor [unclassified Polaribacter]|uniref:trigger factor n=1 Tax=unclassified Polaribacter TaxID=196858 RepID=UPI0011BEF6F1|nr:MULTISPECIES: trigger factor [unclassified Polaribacter]TXD54156.1 trigger factor [Polaribacter sp. IC063]TXD62421.1 trigger factor [Polaribacter sp. IC066]